jgi:hypothetical protein
MTLHLIAVAAVVLGATGTISIATCRSALRCLDLAMVPQHLMPRVRWWRAHAAPALHTSLTMLIAGMAGLLIQ